MNHRRHLLHAAAAAVLAPAVVMRPARALSAAGEGLVLTAADDLCAVRMGGRHFLVGELQVRNAGTEPIRLRRLTVGVGGRTAPPALAIEGDALKSAAVAPDGALAPTLVLRAAEHRDLYLWHALAPRAAEPKWLEVEASRSDGGTGSLRASIDIAPLQPAIALRPPLRRGPWAAVFDPWFAFGHRRAAFARDGRRFIPARFAIDWIHLDSRGSPWPPGRAAFEHWHGLDQDVLAVADGEIVALREGREDLLTSAPPAQPWADDDVAGNYLCLRVADDRYAFYEHLRKGSITVRTGDRVRAGDVIARVGRSGINSSGPHLHFHVADRPELIFAQGRPFVINTYQHIGHYADMEAAESGRAWAPSGPNRPRRIESELPVPNSVLRFAG